MCSGDLILKTVRKTFFDKHGLGLGGLGLGHVVDLSMSCGFGNFFVLRENQAFKNNVTVAGHFLLYNSR